MKSKGCGLTLALVRDLREHRVPASAEELAGFETDVLAGFVLARASAGLADSTIRNDTGHLELIRGWFGRPLWEMQPADADAYFGRVLRDARPSTRTGRAAALTVYFQFLELRHKIEIYNLTSRAAECPLDEMNRPRASVDPQLRVPPTGEEIERLFSGWREELATCRKFARPPGTTPPPGSALVTPQEGRPKAVVEAGARRERSWRRSSDEEQRLGVFDTAFQRDEDLSVAALTAWSTVPA